MSIEIRSYVADDAQGWDAFCAGALQSTLLHTRKFLSYHRDRFQDCSLVLEEEGRLVGVFPAAVHPQEDRTVVSHPGSTYGGIVHQGALRGEAMVAALEAIAAHYRGQGFERLVYKAVPHFYHRGAAQDDLYALFRAGAARTRCDLSSSIDLQHRRAVSERRRRSLKKALKAGLEIVEGPAQLAGLWSVLADNLERKHGTKPVHALAEIELLADRFPAEIRCVCAAREGRVLAGVVLFETATVSHAQYIASSEEGYDVSALDVVFDHCIAGAAQAGRRWFDFGISTERAGTFLNEGLYRFKTEFGGGGSVHEFYELQLMGDRHDG